MISSVLYKHRKIRQQYRFKMTNKCNQCYLDEQFWIMSKGEILNSKSILPPYIISWILDKIQGTDCEVYTEEIRRGDLDKIRDICENMMNSVRSQCNHVKENQCRSCHKQDMYWKNYKRKLEQVQKIVLDDNNVATENWAWVSWYIRYRFGKKSHVYTNIMKKTCNPQIMRKTLLWLDLDTCRTCNHSKIDTPRFNQDNNEDVDVDVGYKLRHNAKLVYFNSVLVSFLSLEELRNIFLTPNKYKGSILETMSFILKQSQHTKTPISYPVDSFSGPQTLTQDIALFLQEEISNSNLPPIFAYHKAGLKQEYIISIDSSSLCASGTSIQWVLQGKNGIVYNTEYNILVVHIDRQKTMIVPSLMQDIQIDQTITISQEKISFELIAVIVHVCVLETTGRYICYRKMKNSEWQQCDDESLKTVEWNYIPTSFVVLCLYSQTI